MYDGRENGEVELAVHPGSRTPLLCICKQTVSALGGNVDCHAVSSDDGFQVFKI